MPPPFPTPTVGPVTDTPTAERRTAGGGPTPPAGPFAPVVRFLAGHPPPGRLSRALLSGKLWRSPIRGPWLTSVFGAVLLVGLPVLALTGLASFLAYQPQFAGNGIPDHVGHLHLPFFAWPASPSWLYRLNQGFHVIGGIVLIPVVLAKLWSVLPKLFSWPPATSVTQALERLSLLLLVGGILFEMVTGVMNIQYDYAFPFFFYTAHYYGAWAFIAGLVVHIVLKVPVMVRALKTRSLAIELRTPRDRTRPEPVDSVPGAEGLAPIAPAEPTTSRRGALAMVAGGSLLLFAVTAGSTLSDRLRSTAIFSPRGRTGGPGPNGFPVNKTAASAGITPEKVGENWRLTLTGPGGRTMSFDRAALLALPQTSAELPIACVEGWSSTQTWTGIPLPELARLVGVPAPSRGVVQSIQRNSFYSTVTLNRHQVRAGNALLALKVNGADLAPDHGYPARVIVPAIPGVHATKWVASIDFSGRAV